ncbi:Iron(3+)-hydroxamate import ATP-binding protein FhuC [Propionispora sp. 2/2-37]|uniref:ABC transporter ATP-binding protein n=1 Tax=Propionispora sp. 2/2-37 TaxID=1677858 RepID=UPI0006BB5D0B|nr:ABC transporter ATP-binding protein [Propionispora sp. 2/2-37]CUH94737.1 Iron(3+)-hydroxamate import ATP-binding protein FhuC [Propionispora sp. 2/2-37]
MSILRVENLTAGYEKRLVFQELNFAVKQGKITTIVGPNGCGKSTLLKTMGRIIKQKKGTVYLREQELQQLHTEQIAKELTLLPQNPLAPQEIKVGELVAYGRFPYRRNLLQMNRQDRSAVERALEITRTISFRDRELGSLSGGERQKVWLAMALAQETDILLLDEPTTYLDMVHQLEVLKIVQQLNRERQCTIVMVLHDINHAARFSHEIVAMRAGRILAAGTPLEIITPEVLRQVFQIEARVMLDPQDGTPICFHYDSVAIEKEAEGDGSCKEV